MSLAQGELRVIRTTRPLMPQSWTLPQWTTWIRQCRRVADAHAALSDMRTSSVEPDVITYNAAISVCTRVRAWADGVGAWANGLSRARATGGGTWSAVE